MTKHLMVLALALVLLLSGCAQAAASTPSPYGVVNDLPQVKLELLSVDNAELCIAFVNHSQETMYAYGDYYLERPEDGVWMTVPYVTAEHNDAPPFPSSDSEALPGGRSDTAGGENIPIGAYFGRSSLLEWEPKLPAGTYRIVKPVCEASSLNIWHYLTAEFTLG